MLKIKYMRPSEVFKYYEKRPGEIGKIGSIHTSNLESIFDQILDMDEVYDKYKFLDEVDGTDLLQCEVDWTLDDIHELYEIFLQLLNLFSQELKTNIHYESPQEHFNDVLFNHSFFGKSLFEKISSKIKSGPYKDQIHKIIEKTKNIILSSAVIPYSTNRYISMPSSMNRVMENVDQEREEIDQPLAQP